MFGIHKEDGKHKEIREGDGEAQREIIRKKESRLMKCQKTENCQARSGTQVGKIKKGQ